MALFNYLVNRFIYSVGLVVKRTLVTMVMDSGKIDSGKIDSGKMDNGQTDNEHWYRPFKWWLHSLLSKCP